MKKMLYTAALAAAAFVGSAAAKSDSKMAYDTKVINKFGQVGLWNTHSAHVLGMGRLAFNVYGTHTGHDEYIHDIYRLQNGSLNSILGDSLEAPQYTRSTINVALAYGFTRFLDLGVMVPVYIDWMDNLEWQDNGVDNFFPKKSSVVGGAGDLEVSMKFQYPPYPHRKFFEMAYYGALTVPTGNSAISYFPRHKYYMNKNTGNVEAVNFFTAGSGKVDIDMKMLWTWDFREVADFFPVLLHMNYGLKWTTQYQNEHIFMFNTGLEVRPTDFLSLFLDFSAEPAFGAVQQDEKVRPTDGVIIKRNMLQEPMRLAPGVAFLIPGGFNITAGAEFGLSDKSGYFVTSSESSDRWTTNTGEPVIIETAVEPKASFAASIGWNGFVMPQDFDNDGIKDNMDNCPREAEDFDGYNDGDGCPEVDNDNDGIADTLDKCPNEAEDLDGFEDEDGCPEVDNDGDGIPDLQDKCPMVAEDMDGFEDEDGCPEEDNDNDGILDSLDACPDKAEDKDGFEDTDGCPDMDNDGDQIVDSLDKCPMEAETFNTFEDTDGCPDTKPVEKVAPVAKELKRNLVLRGVNFQSGKAVLTTESYEILDDVVNSLREWPEIKIEVVGHTDSQGNERANKRLSYNRAKSVMTYFTQQGIATERMRAVGMGEEMPIADNGTANGRALNRRVELRRID